MDATALAQRILASVGSPKTRGAAPPPALPEGGTDIATQLQPTLDLTRSNLQQGMSGIADIQQPAPAKGGAFSPPELLAARILNAQHFDQRMQTIAGMPGKVAETAGMANGLPPEQQRQMGLTPEGIIDTAYGGLKAAGGVGLNALDVAGSQLGRPSQFVMHTAKSLGEGDQWGEALKKGLIGSTQYGWHNDHYVSGGDVLQAWGMEPGATLKSAGALPAWNERSALGQGLEFVSDPMSWIGIGAKHGADLLDKSGRYLNPSGMKALLEMEKAGVLADNAVVKTWLETRGRPELVDALTRVKDAAREIIENPTAEVIARNKPNLAKVYGEVLREINKGAAEGALTIPHSTIEGEHIPVRHFDPVLREQYADKLADLMHKDPAVNRAYEDPGGLKFAGQTVIPGRQTKEAIKAAFAASGETVESLGEKLQQFAPTRSVGRLIERVPATLGSVGDSIGKALSTVAGLPPRFARYMQHDYVAQFRSIDYGLRQTLEKMFKGLDYSTAVDISKAIDERRLPAFLEKNPKLRETIDGIFQAHKELTDAQIKRKLLEPDALRDNYVFHFYKNTAKAREVLASKGLLRSPRTLDPSTYQRAYDTLEEARLAGLQPEYDIRKLTHMRLLNGWRSVVAHDFLEGTAAKFGIDVPETTRKLAALAEGETIKVAPTMAQRIRSGLVDVSDPRSAKEIAQSLVLEGNTPLDIIDRLPDNVKRDFLRTRFAKAIKYGGPREFANVKAKYAKYGAFWPNKFAESGDLTGATFGLPALTREDGAWRTVQIPKVGNVLLPQRITEKLAELQETGVFNRSGGPLRAMLAAYDRFFLNPFRLANTMLWPSFHFRNVYTNVVQSGMDIGLAVLNPQTRFEANAILRGQKGLRLATKRGEVLAGEQVLSELIRGGGMNTMYKRAQIAGSGLAENAADDLVRSLDHSRALNPFAWPLAIGSTVGTAIENDARLAHYWALRKDGIGSSQSMERMFKFLFDYDNITPIERAVFRRAIPFWTWLKKNSALQTEMLFRKPRIALGYQRALAALQNEKSPERVYLEKDLMPEYYRQEWAINMGPGEAPQVTRYLMGLDMPLSDLNHFMDKNITNTLDQWTQQFGPAGQVGEALYALAGGRDNIRDGIDQTAPSYWIFDTLLKRAELAPLANLLGVRKGFDRQNRAIIKADPAKTRALLVMTTLDRPLRELSRFVGPEDSWTSALARYLTGFRFMDFNPEEARRSRIDHAYTRTMDYLNRARGDIDTALLKGPEALQYGTEEAPEDAAPDE